MPYRSYRELTINERRGRDYIVQTRPGRTGLLVMAPHGGGIEPGTDNLARALAGRHHALYSFIGLKPCGNRVLHLASHRFDEPVALRMARPAQWILTLHGCALADATIRVGGGDRAGGRLFQRCLHTFGFRARISRHDYLAGRHPANLCNRGRGRRGVQLEIARDLREPLIQAADHHPLARRLIKALTTALGSIGTSCHPARGRIMEYR